MNRQQLNDLRALSSAELAQKRAAAEKELYELRQKKITGQLDKPHQFSQARKLIARIQTIEREKKNG
jgi:large subunit ribosomal protein L29